MTEPTRPDPLIIRPRPRRNWMRIILVSVILLFAGVAGLGVWFSMYFGNGIQERILRELNKNLKTQVIVRGSVKFSVFSFFPNASLQINDIVVMGSTGEKDDTLLQAGRLSLLTNIFDVINRKWEIKSIVIENGRLNMQRHADGVINYDITKNTGASKDTSSIFVNIREAVLKNINFRYNDQLSAVDIGLAVDRVSLEGNFSAARLDVKTEGALLINTLALKGIDYGNGKKVKVAGVFQALPEKNSYTVKSENIFIEDNHFSLNGTVSSQHEQTDMDIRVKGISLSIDGLLKLFPAQYAKQWTDYNASGNLQFDVAVKGILSKTKNPQVTVNYKVNKTKLHYHKLEKDIRDVSFEGSYTNGARQSMETSEIIVKGMNGYLGDKPIYVQFDLKNITDPSLKLEVDGYLALDLFNSFLSDSSAVHDLKGGVTIEGFAYNGRLDDLKPTTERIPDIKGSFTFKDAHIRWDTTTLDVPAGMVSLTPSTIVLDSVRVKLANSSLSLQGRVEDWKGYVYALMNSGHVAAKPMIVNLSADADRIILENFANLDRASNKPNRKGQAVAQANPVSLGDILNVKGSLSVKTKQLSYNKFAAENVNGDVVFTPGHAELRDLSMKTMKGEFRMISDLTVNGANIQALSSLHGTNIDVSELFYEMNNFGEKELTNKNLKGTLTTNAKINTYFTNGKMDLGKLYVQADVRIDNGELVSYTPLKSLSKFIDINELNDVKFSTLQNEIEIKDQTISIPRMIVRSSALNMSLAGTHTFSNMIDYRVKLNLYDILAYKIRKRKRVKDSFEVVDDNSFNFFISMKGPIDNPVVKYDKQGVVERFKQQGAEIRANIKGTKEKYNPDKEKHDWDTKDTLQFIEWDK